MRRKISHFGQMNGARRFAGLVCLLLLAGCTTATSYMGIDLAARPDAPERRYIQTLAKRAQGGDKQAQLALGKRFEEGRGVARDLKKARKLYVKAASDSGGTIWVYSPPVGNGTKGRTIPVSTGPKQAGLVEAGRRLQLIEADALLNESADADPANGTSCEYSDNEQAPSLNPDEWPSPDSDSYFVATQYDFVTTLMKIRKLIGDCKDSKNPILPNYLLELYQSKVSDQYPAGLSRDIIRCRPVPDNDQPLYVIMKQLCEQDGMAIASYHLEQGWLASVAGENISFRDSSSKSAVAQSLSMKAPDLISFLLDNGFQQQKIYEMPKIIGWHIEAYNKEGHHLSCNKKLRICIYIRYLDEISNLPIERQKILQSDELYMKNTNGIESVSFIWPYTQTEVK